MPVDKAYIENRIKNPAGHGIKEIKVLRDKKGELPVNEQIGPTCAIYALHAAITIKNGNCRLARKNVYGDWRTITGRAKSMRELAKDGRLVD